MSELCQNCNDCQCREAVIAYLPDRNEKWADFRPTLWCFGCFIDNYCAIDGSIVVRPRAARDSTTPHAPLAGDIVRDVDYAKPLPKADA